MKYRIFICILLFFFFIGFAVSARAEIPNSASSQAADSDPYNKSFASRHLTIKYVEGVRLRVVNKRLKIYFRDIVLDRERPRRFDTDEDEIAFKLDKILRKVRKILDMRPLKMDITIKIFRNQKQLNDHYYSLFRSQNRRHILSYYIHARKTIYATERTISSTIIAHEMAHAVLRHYFLVRPPTNVDELMAQYVELHLND